jgi:NadR type nicotinamide-nucleotide adenylyltransferase
VKPRHGLVIGKFYPPHAGHHHLVRAASRGAERVTVVVMAATVESLSLADRVRWMREVHATDDNVTVTGIFDDHPVDYESDEIWRAHVDLMEQAARAVTREPVDAVFTSETYGDELARRLGVRHFAVDPGRATQPISGTAIREDPVQNWGALAPCVRAHLAFRVVLVGAESTGKTTLAESLADCLRERGGAFAGASWVPEVGREVTERKLAALGPEAAMDAVEWRTEDFVDIAREQAAREHAAARDGAPVLVCDTDAFATSIWHERYRGERSARVEAEGAVAPYHLYLLTHHEDVPFHQDGLRDGEHLRAWMTERFVQRLEEDGRLWRWARGSRDERAAAALREIDALLEAGWGFSAPLG